MISYILQHESSFPIIHLACCTLTFTLPPASRAGRDGAAARRPARRPLLEVRPRGRPTRLEKPLLVGGELWEDAKGGRRGWGGFRMRRTRVGARKGRGGHGGGKRERDAPTSLMILKMDDQFASTEAIAEFKAPHRKYQGQRQRTPGRRPLSKPDMRAQHPLPPSFLLSPPTFSMPVVRTSSTLSHHISAIRQLLRAREQRGRRGE